MSDDHITDALDHLSARRQASATKRRQQRIRALESILRGPGFGPKAGDLLFPASRLETMATERLAEAYALLTEVELVATLRKDYEGALSRLEDLEKQKK